MDISQRVTPERHVEVKSSVDNDYMVALERVERANRAAEPELPSVRRYLVLRDIHAHRETARASRADYQRKTERGE